MSIGIAHQYEIFFSLGSFPDFIKEEDFDHFTLIEEIDCKLPTFELIFKTKNKSLLPLLNEGNVLNVSMKDPQKTVLDTNIIITYSQVGRTGVDSFLVTLQGMYNAIDFLLKQRCRILKTKKINALEAITTVVSPYFSLMTNCTPSSDIMYWVQHGMSDKRFATAIWLHSERPKSFAMVGITSEGVFVYKDAVKTLAEGPTADFSYTPNDGYLVEENYTVQNDSTFLNSWASYGIKQHETNLISGANPRVTTEPLDPIFSLASTLNRRSNHSKRFYDPLQYSPDNVHPTYWACYKTNVTSLTVNSVLKISVNISHQHVPIQVLDLVRFKDDELNKPRAIEDYSGLYLITKISRTFMNRDIYNTVELSRDSLNTQKGTLR